jgi:hypothetical protein
MVSGVREISAVVQLRFYTRYPLRTVERFPGKELQATGIQEQEILPFGEIEIKVESRLLDGD